MCPDNLLSKEERKEALLMWHLVFTCGSYDVLAYTQTEAIFKLGLGIPSECFPVKESVVTLGSVYRQFELISAQLENVIKLLEGLGKEAIL
jgi:hypothetical protein